MAAICGFTALRLIFASVLHGPHYPSLRILAYFYNVEIFLRFELPRFLLHYSGLSLSITLLLRYGIMVGVCIGNSYIVRQSKIVHGTV